MNPTCIDLWRTFGRDYRVGTDPACDPASINIDKLDPWCFIMTGKAGTIWSYGGDLLAVDIDYHNSIAKKVRAVSGVSVLIDGDREKTFLFPLRLFQEVAVLVQPRRRRKLSPERRKAAAARLVPYHFVKT